MKTIAEGVDRALLGRVHAYLGSPASRVGKLGGLSSSTAKDYVLDAREKLNIAKAPVDGRKLVMAPTSETAMLKTDLFLKANERGDGGTALENAILGRILGFDTYMDQNVNCVLSGSGHRQRSGHAAVCGGRRRATSSPCWPRPRVSSWSSPATTSRPGRPARTPPGSP